MAFFCYRSQLNKAPCVSIISIIKDFAPAPEGVAAAVSLFVSSTNYFQIVRRQCCLCGSPVEIVAIGALLEQLQGGARIACM